MPARANARRDARAGPAARAMRSRVSAPPFCGDAVHDLPDLVLQLVLCCAIDIELGADRIADRAVRRAMRREITDEERLSLAAQCLDPLEMMRAHGENDVAGPDEVP